MASGKVINENLDSGQLPPNRYWYSWKVSCGRKIIAVRKTPFLSKSD